MTKDEALTLALDAFLRIESCECIRAQEKAITAIKQALAQPEHQSTADKSKLEKVPAKGTLLAHPEQEPVAYAAMINGEIAWDADYPFSNEPFSCFDDEQSVPLYTTLPQRTWVGLTDEDKQTAFDETQEGGGFWEFADAIEAKLKEKNQ